MWCAQRNRRISWKIPRNVFSQILHFYTMFCKCIVKMKAYIMAEFVYNNQDDFHYSNNKTFFCIMLNRIFLWNWAKKASVTIVSNCYNYKAAVFKKNWHSELFLCSCYCWFNVVECCFNITERHKRCCHIESHPQSAKSPYGMWGEWNNSYIFLTSCLFLASIHIYIFMISIYSSRFTLWFVNMRSNLITYFFVCLFCILD